VQLLSNREWHNGGPSFPTHLYNLNSWFKLATGQSVPNLISAHAPLPHGYRPSFNTGFLLLWNNRVHQCPQETFPLNYTLGWKPSTSHLFSSSSVNAQMPFSTNSCQATEPQGSALLIPKPATGHHPPPVTFTTYPYKLTTSPKPIIVLPSQNLPRSLKRKVSIIPTKFLYSIVSIFTATCSVHCNFPHLTTITIPGDLHTLLSSTLCNSLKFHSMFIELMSKFQKGHLTMTETVKGFVNIRGRSNSPSLLFILK